MPRIPEEEIERIKRQTDLAALVRSRGIELRKHGGNGHLAGKCPFHAEETASFIVTPAKGLFHCMGCGAAGNAIQFVEQFDGVSFRHAFELLNAGKAAFTPASPSGERVKAATVPRLESPFDVPRRSSDVSRHSPEGTTAEGAETGPVLTDAEILLRVVDFYHARLWQTPAAVDYLKGRGLYNEEALRAFRIGFADRTLGLRIPEGNRQAGSEIRGRLQRLGIIRESGHEHFSGSVVLPIFTASGEACPASGGVGDDARRVTEMYGRKITPNLRKGTPLHLYLPGAHKGIWNYEGCFGSEACHAEGVVILCEAAFDALTFWVNNIRNVTFIYGTEGFTDELFAAILANKVRRVYLAYDADEAGNRAAARDAFRLTAQGVEVFRVKFPWGMDANEYACKACHAGGVAQPPGGFDKLTAGGFDKLTAGGFDKLTVNKSLQVLLNAAEWVGGVRGSQFAVHSNKIAANLLAADKSAAKGVNSHENLSGFTGVAEGDRVDSTGVCSGEAAAERGALRPGKSDSAGGGVDSGEYSRGTGAGTCEGVHTISDHRQRKSGGVGNTPDRFGTVEIPASAGFGNGGVGDGGNGTITQRPAEQSSLRTENWKPGTGARLEKHGEYHVLQLGAREYRVGGLEKNNSLEVMKVSLRLLAHRTGATFKVQGSQLAEKPGTVNDAPGTEADAYFHHDVLDLLQDQHRRKFIERAAEETRLEKELIKRDLGKLLLLLEQEQSARINSALTCRGAASERSREPEMTAAERAEALAFLKAPDLVEKIGEAFETCGLVGEGANRLAAYLACTSRKLERPLAVIIQSTSAAGKSALMESVLGMFPEEERIKYSAMTGQSLYYLGETNLKNKILAIVEEEGAEKAGYALKLLQSEGELTIASTGKDPQTGRMETQEYHVEGPVMIFLTTTAVEIDEELLNRCLILTVDESREQTARIHKQQRQARTLEGLVAREEKKDLLRVLRNAQRLLQPLAVVNPHADELTFTAERTRTRRDHEKYLTLIDAIALLHQHQREKFTVPSSRFAVIPGVRTENREPRTEFIRATLEDITLANRLAPELLGRSLDELPPQTRRVYEVIKAVVRERCDGEKIEQRVAFFSRREIRSRLGWGITQIRAHLERLRELEYIAARYGRPGSSYQYELLTDCRETSDKAHIGLLDVEQLRLRRPTCREKTPPVGGVSECPPTGSTP